MITNQKAVPQKFNSVSNVVSFNKKKSIKVDSFTRQKNFDKPRIDSSRGNIFKHQQQNDNVLQPSLFINNATRKSTSADLANVRPSFRKSNPVKYYSDFTIVSALENSTKNGKFHLDVNSIDRLKDYLRDYDPTKDPNKEIDNIPDITPIPKIIPYTPDDDAPPIDSPSNTMPDADPPILPKTTWKTRLWSVAKWSSVLAAIGLSATAINELYKDKRFDRERHDNEVRSRIRLPDDEFGIGFDDSNDDVFGLPNDDGFYNDRFLPSNEKLLPLNPKFNYRPLPFNPN